jgi:hypothetical protein
MSVVTATSGAAGPANRHFEPAAITSGHNAGTSHGIVASAQNFLREHAWAAWVLLVIGALRLGVAGQSASRMAASAVGFVAFLISHHVAIFLRVARELRSLEIELRSRDIS